MKFSHIRLTALSLLCVTSSCCQTSKIHFLKQHQPVKNCAAEKIVGVWQNTTLKMGLEFYTDIAIITQLHYQLHVSANVAVAIIRLDTIYQRNYIDMI